MPAVEWKRRTLPNNPQLCSRTLSIESFKVHGGREHQAGVADFDVAIDSRRINDYHGGVNLNVMF